MFATRDIVRGERIAVDVPFMVLPENIMYMPGSDLTYEISEELEQACESMLPQDQKDFLALHDGDAPLVDLKSLLQDISSTNQFSIGQMPGGDENVQYACVVKDVSRANHR